MPDGWNQLLCPYFYDVCLEVLGPYFSVRGFTRHNDDGVGGVIFRDRQRFVEVSYEVETAPNYSVTLLMGLRSDAEEAESEAVPFWHLVPSTAEGSRYSFWRFRTEDDLRAVLKHVEIAVLEPIGRPLWEDTKRLRAEVAQFRDGGDRTQRGV